MKIFFHEKFHLFLRIFTRLFQHRESNFTAPRTVSTHYFFPRDTNELMTCLTYLSGVSWVRLYKGCTETRRRRDEKKNNRGKKSAKIINFISRTRHCASFFSTRVILTFFSLISVSISLIVTQIILFFHYFSLFWFFLLFNRKNLLFSDKLMIFPRKKRCTVPNSRARRTF